MRKSLVAIGLNLLLTGTVLSAEAGMDTDLMQSIEDSTKSLSSAIDLKDAKSVTDEARELEKLFEHVEAFYAKQGNAEDALSLSRKSRDWASTLAKLASDKDFDSASTTARDLTRACKSCHNVYKS